MFWTIMITMFMCTLPCLDVKAEIFHKDESLVNEVKEPTPSNEGKDEMDCSKNPNTSCKGTEKPMRFSAFGECKLISTVNGMSVFIPARSKQEWDSFITWAKANPQTITVDDCINPKWSPWSACSNTCGKGESTRTCNLPLKEDGSLGCDGPAKRECEDKSGC